MRRTLVAFPVAFAVWTLFVWGVRIKNADGSAGAILLAATFVVPAVGVLVTRGDRRRAVVRGLAAWTVVVWAVRVVDIVLLSDHGTAFKVVHVALGAISVALAGLAVRTRRAAATVHS